ncbi:MAG TPA: hypothetical protein VD761_00695 [Solirubrobacterales bacterium]|nr:hypothetical protein [Solirubrobacterales bacterium]
MAGDPVEQAYREGKFSASRRAFWHKRMGKRPKATRRELAQLEAVLPPPGGEDAEVLEDLRAEQGGSHAAPVAASAPSAPSGPSDYPQEWLDRGSVIGRSSGVGGSIIQEPSVGAAPVAAGPGEVL